MKLKLINIGMLVGIVPAGVLRKEGKAMNELETLEKAWLMVEDGRIAAFGQGEGPEADQVVDAEGRWLFPSFCDAHTHLVYAGSREQ